MASITEASTYISVRFTQVQINTRGKCVNSTPDKFIKTIILLISFGFTIFFGYKGLAAEMTLMIVAGAVFLSFLNIDKFKAFKGAGFSAELKDTLDKASATKVELEDLSTKIESQLVNLSKQVESAKELAITKSELEELSSKVEVQMVDLKEKIKGAETLALIAI